MDFHLSRGTHAEPATQKPKSKSESWNPDLEFKFANAILILRPGSAANAFASFEPEFDKISEVPGRMARPFTRRGLHGIITSEVIELVARRTKLIPEKLIWTYFRRSIAEQSYDRSEERPLPKFLRMT
jgi:hypothetical protein